MGKATLRFRPNQGGLTVIAGVKFVSATLVHLSAIEGHIQDDPKRKPLTQERNPMSPNVGNFVHDLVEMAKAMETLPQVQGELDRANTAIENYAKQVQDREIAIIDYKAKIEELQSKVRATEAERDDAELRFLELDEKANKVIAWVHQIGDLADNVEAKLEAREPQPEPEAQPVTANVGLGSSEVPPTQTSTSPSGSLQDTHGGNEPDWKQDQAETSTLPPKPQPAASQGQGEVNPTYTTAETDGVGGTAGTAIPSVGNQWAEPKPSGPYANKLYHDHPVYVSILDWIDGGGTKESYDWQPPARSDGWVV